MKILHFTNTPWHGGQMMCRQFITKSLSRYCSNFYYNDPSELRTILASRSHFFSKSRVVPLKNNVIVFELSPWLGKTYKCDILNRWQFHRRARYINEHLNLDETEKLVLYLWDYNYFEYTNILKYDLLVYHIYDDVFGYDTNLPNHLLERYKAVEKSLIAKSDIIVVNGEPLAKEKQIPEDKLLCCLNGVDIDMFSRNYPNVISEFGLPRRKIVGYFGMINAKIDFKLFLDLTQIASEYHFLLAGLVGHLNKHDASLWKKILKQPNVSHVGLKSIEEVAKLTGSIDIGFMPYRNKAWAKFIFPVKLFQFLAAGKPVISTPLASLLPFSNVVTLETTAEGFKRAFDRAINCDSKEKIESRIRIAKENSWDARAGEIYNRIQEKLKEPSPKSSLYEQKLLKA